MRQSDKFQVRTIREHAQSVSDARQHFDALMELIGNAHFVLIGEASHGTHDFYDLRARISEWLIQEKGFSAIAIEGDWPDAYRVNRYIQGRGDDADAVHGYLQRLEASDDTAAWLGLAVAVRRSRRLAATARVVAERPEVMAAIYAKLRSSESQQMATMAEWLAESVRDRPESATCLGRY